MTLNNTNFPLIQDLYTQGTGAFSSNPYVTYFSLRDPTPADVNYPVQKRWVNFALVKEWILENYTNISGQTQANWVLLASAAGLTLNIPVPQGTSPVVPSALGTLSFTSLNNSVTITGGLNTIDFATTATGLTGLIPDMFTPPGTSPVVPNPLTLDIIVTGILAAAGSRPVFTNSTAANTIDIEVQASSAHAISSMLFPGLASFNSAQFTVDGNGYVSLIGSMVNNPTLGLIPDTFTTPGTSPITPNPATGDITVTGSLVAAGTHPVRTDSLAANTMEIEVQTSQAIASTNATNVGLAAFNSAQFTVDGNGFVSLLGAGGTGGIVQQVRTSFSTPAQSTRTIFPGQGPLIGTLPTQANTDFLMSVTLTPHNVSDILYFDFSTTYSYGQPGLAAFFFFAGNTLLNIFYPLVSAFTGIPNAASFEFFAVAGTTSSTVYSIYWSGTGNNPLVSVNHPPAYTTGGPWGGATPFTQFTVTEHLP